MSVKRTATVGTDTTRGQPANPDPQTDTGR
jgi:hypothetical protein